ncbi:MAG TPA: cbb3-type cytochrome c oxidase subunit I [Candidatus Limnocylindria bacterium]|nr:cbb3-type cytochrome c oxidase subunit I [Candidatus Limnocylindria bacterium]
MSMQAHAESPAHHFDHPEPTTFLRKYVFSVDHKVIGKQYLGIGVFMAVAGGLMAYLIRWQLAWPETPVPGFGWVPEPYMYEGAIPPEFYNSMVTMHGTIMVFFAAMPILLGAFGNFLLPIMVGAPDMAFPRLNMMSVWTLGVASLVLIASFFMPGGAAAHGWTGYAPLSAKAAYTGVDWGGTLWILALALEFASFLMGGVNFLVTAINMRAPGMSLMRLPLLVWMQLTAAVLFMLSVGPLVAAAIMLLLDRTLGTGFFLPERGGDPLLWQHLFWFFGHPEVYVILLPGFGIVMEILPVFARKPIFGYRSIVWSTIAAGALSFIVWAHHMFVSGIDARLATPFSITTILISVPFAIIMFAMIATLWGGSIVLTTPMLFALGVIATFLIGGVTGIFLGSAAVDIYLHDTYFVLAHFHYTLFPSVILAGLGGLYFWWPKMTGRMLNETLGKIHFWLTFIAFNCVFLPLFLVGVGGHHRRIYDPYQYDFLKPFQPVHEFATMAAIVLILSQLLLLVNVVMSLMSGEKAPANPWGANTLEWQTDSPPPHGNFKTVPTVYRDPYDYSVPGAALDFLPQTHP